MDLAGVRPWRRHGQQGGVEAAQCRVGNGIAGGEVELEMRQLARQPVQAWNHPAPEETAGAAQHQRIQIGRASCRDRVCQYVYISVVAVQLKKKITNEQ